MPDNMMDVSEALELLESAGWPDLADRLIQGFCHGMNGRVSSLMGLIYLVRKRGADDPSLLQAMDSELGRLEGLVGLMENVPFGGETELEALSLAETLPGILELHGRQKGMEVLELEIRLEEAPPVLMNRTVLTRTVLLLLAWTTERVRRKGGSVVEVSLRREADGAAIGLGPFQGSATAGVALEGEDPTAGLRFRPGITERLVRVAEGFGGRLEAGEMEGIHPGVELWLPSLEAARKGN